MSEDHDRADGVVARLLQVRARIADAEHAAGRDAGSVRLLLATKTVPAALVRAAIGAGIDLIGENRVQELVAKGPELASQPVEIHLIGHLQGNKVNPALRWASCVQSVDSLEIAARLAERCADAGRVLDVMLQVNVSGEESKFGVLPAAAADVAAEVGELVGLRLRGFMTIGANSPDGGRVRAGYARLREVRDDVVGDSAGARTRTETGTGSGARTRTETGAGSGARAGAGSGAGAAAATELSMGMSGDLELAIAEGATIVRIGTAVFGARPA